MSEFSFDSPDERQAISGSFDRSMPPVAEIGSISSSSLISVQDIDTTRNVKLWGVTGVQQAPRIITPASFPLPDRADTFARPLSSADQAALAKRKEFAQYHAEVSNTLLATLESLETPPTVKDWTNIYQAIIDWRSTLEPSHFGQYAPGKERLTMPITDESPNYDQIGDLGRRRTGAVWSIELNAWVGGEPTPASRVFSQAAERAAIRFELEGVTGDELQNMVRLPDGRMVRGNRIVRGESARQIALKQKRLMEKRGRDASKFETEVEGMMFCVTATEADRKIIFQAAMQALANQSRGKCSPNIIKNTSYLLYQSPKTQRGSDAVIRTFLVTAGTYLTRKAPILPQDIDLRAYTSSQDDFIRYLEVPELDHGFNNFSSL